MFQNINATNIENGSPFRFSIKLPDSCPHCGKFIKPVFLSGHYLERYENLSETTYPYEILIKLFISFLCSNCEKNFISEYQDYCDADFNFINSLGTANIYPAFHSEIIHSQKIKELSPKFVEIYRQASFAEESGLYEICGMGYRKALEFLIKDFAIRMHPEELENIKSKMLGKCIADHIDNPKIKSLARASAWLGNDQTHYIMKNEDYSINDLKCFIVAAEAFINAELEVLDAEILLGIGG